MSGESERPADPLLVLPFIVVRPASVEGDPVMKSTGPGRTTIVCPWPLMYHCGRAFSFSFASSLWMWSSF